VVTTDDARAIVSGDAECIVRCAKGVADRLGGVRKHQIRNVYSALVRIRALDDPQKQRSQLVLLRPRLAYMRARSTKTAPLQDALEKVIQALPKQDRGSDASSLQAVFDFAEAIVAYHHVKGA